MYLLETKSIPTQIQRLLHSRTVGKEPYRNQGQPWTHNQGPLQICQKDTHDGKGMPIV